MENYRHLFKRLFNYISYTSRIQIVCAVWIAFLGVMIYQFHLFEEPAEKLFRSKILGVKQHTTLVEMLEQSLKAELAIQEGLVKEGEFLANEIEKELILFLADMHAHIPPESTSVRRLLEDAESLWSSVKRGVGSEKWVKSWAAFSRSILYLIYANYRHQDLSLHDDLENYLIANSMFIHFPSLQVSLVEIEMLIERKAKLAKYNRSFENARRELKTLTDQLAFIKEPKPSDGDPLANRDPKKLIRDYFDRVEAYLNRVSQTRGALEEGGGENINELLNNGWNLSEQLISTFETDQQGSLDALVTNRNIVYFLSAAMFLTFILIYITRIIHKPIQDLLKGVNSLLKGDLTARVTVSTLDEVGDIANSFNGFAERWQHFVTGSGLAAQRLHSTLSKELAGVLKSEDFVRTQEVLIDKLELSGKNSLIEGNRLLDVLSKINRTSAIGLQNNNPWQISGGADISQSSKEMRETLVRLSQRIATYHSAIGSAVQMVDQSNLLFINTALKAQRSDDLGKGFVVVAKSMRQLANQTASATLDTENILTAIFTQIQRGVKEIEVFIDEVDKEISLEGNFKGALHEREAFAKIKSEAVAAVSAEAQNELLNLQKSSALLHNFAVATIHLEQATHKLKIDLESMNSKVEELLNQNLTP